MLIVQQLQLQLHQYFLTYSFVEYYCGQLLVSEQTRHPAWGEYAQRLLDPQQQLWKQPGDGGHDDKAHPPIHPTRFSEGEANWTNDHSVCMYLAFRTLTFRSDCVCLRIQRIPTWLTT